MIKNKIVTELLNELIDLGHELEANDYNNRFVGYEGFTEKDLADQEKAVREKARIVLTELKKHNVNPYELDYTYIDDSGIEWELEYALQFI